MLTMNNKGIILAACILFAALASPLAADDFLSLGLGVHLGAHHDVGNVSNQDRNILQDPQNSLLAGFSLKLNAYIFFIRTGCDITAQINRGNVLDTTPPHPVEYTSFSYVALPAFLGIRYPLKDVGEFYMGAGMAYFLGSGEVKLTASASAEEVDTSAYGYGLVTGIEFKLLQFLHLYMEWEYFEARSEPVLSTGDFFMDFSGHRILIGAMYFLL